MNIISEGKLKAGMAFIKLAKKYGAKLVRSKKHNVFRDAAGHQITAPKTTSDFRAIKNFESELKNRGFVNQETVSKVKDSLVKGSKETVLKPAVKKQPASRQQQTFKDFTQKYQPNVQGPRKPNTPPRVRVQGPESELAHRHRTAFDKMLDNVIKDVRGRKVPTTKRKKISKAELDKMNIPQREKDKLIRQGLVENKYRAAAQLMNKAGIRKPSDLRRVVDVIKQQVGDKIIQGIRTPKQPTKKGLELQKRMSRAVDKNKDKYPGLFDEQMVVPRGLKKKSSFMSPKTEMEILKRLSNRKTVYDRAVTGKAMYPFSEDNRHRDAKLNYQYKEVTNPKRPVDPIKVMKKGKV